MAATVTTATAGELKEGAGGTTTRRSRAALYDPNPYGMALPPGVVGAERTLYMDFARSTHARAAVAARERRLRAAGDAARAQFYDVLNTNSDKTSGKRQIYAWMRRKDREAGILPHKTLSTTTTAPPAAVSLPTMATSGTQTELTCFIEPRVGVRVGMEHRGSQQQQQQQQTLFDSGLQQLLLRDEPTRTTTSGEPTPTDVVLHLGGRGSTPTPQQQQQQQQKTAGKRKPYIIPSSCPPLRPVVNHSVAAATTTSATSAPLTPAVLQQQVLTLHTALQRQMREDRLRRLRCGDEVSIPLASLAAAAALRAEMMTTTAGSASLVRAPTPTPTPTPPPAS